MVSLADPDYNDPSLKSNIISGKLIEAPLEGKLQLDFFRRIFHISPAHRMKLHEVVADHQALQHPFWDTLVY